MGYSLANWHHKTDILEFPLIFSCDTWDNAVLILGKATQFRLHPNPDLLENPNTDACLVCLGCFSFSHALFTSQHSHVYDVILNSISLYST
jgi:hypothetical protein